MERLIELRKKIKSLEAEREQLKRQQQLFKLILIEQEKFNILTIEGERLRDIYIEKRKLGFKDWNDYNLYMRDRDIYENVSKKVIKNLNLLRKIRDIQKFQKIEI